MSEPAITDPVAFHRVCGEHFEEARLGGNTSEYKDEYTVSCRHSIQTAKSTASDAGRHTRGVDMWSGFSWLSEHVLKIAAKHGWTVHPPVIETADGETHFSWYFVHTIYKQRADGEHAGT